jgi:uncharacterized membrane protein HdeD (DUF308 family)
MMNEAEAAMAHSRDLARHVLQSIAGALFLAGGVMIGVMVLATLVTAVFPGAWLIPVAGVFAAGALLNVRGDSVPGVPDVSRSRSTES